MRKNFTIILFLFICLIFNTQNVSASKATCTYDSSMGAIPTYTFTYEYNEKLKVSPSVDVLEVVYEDFVDKNYNIICPKLYIYRKSTGKNKYEATIKLASDVESTDYNKQYFVSGKLKILVSDNLEKESEGKANKMPCGYNEGSDIEFQLYWESGLKVNTIGKNFTENNWKYTIKGEFLESDFADNKCPEIHDQVVAKAKEVIISKNSIMTEDEPGEDADYQEDLNDGSHNSDNLDPDVGNDPNQGTIQTGCEVIPEVVRKWINNILNFVRYVALALVIALGALDFMKAAGSGEGDAMKKAGQSFMKRMIAVVILFLLPVIVDFILNMINIYGVDTNNIDCL